jgi:hypothetical protein
MRNLVWAVSAGLLVLCASAADSTAQVRFVAADIPVDLDGATRQPSDLLRTSGSSYSSELALPAGTKLAAAHKERDGDWLLVVAETATLGGVEATARDVVRYDLGVYSVEHSGDTLGLPAEAQIDALFRGEDGRLRVSFAAPVQLDGTFHGRSDLVVYDGTSFSLEWDAEAAGVPLYANLSAAAIDPQGNVVVGFDVPTGIAGTDYLPGQLVQVTGGAQSYALDSGWPISAELAALSLTPTAPPVPSGAPGESAALSVTEVGDGSITLSWGAPCNGAHDMDYSVYEGAIGDWSNLSQRTCGTGGLQSFSFTPGAGARFFLVTATNGDAESSYGLRSDGTERPAPAAACYPSAPGSCYDAVQSIGASDIDASISTGAPAFESSPRPAIDRRPSRSERPRMNIRPLRPGGILR